MKITSQPCRQWSMVDGCKKLDGDPVANHKFLAQRGVLMARKIEIPSLRLSAALREELNIQEECVTGLRGPKTKFMELSAYERRFGQAPEDRIKQQIYNGVVVRGVDVIAEEDCDFQKA